MSIREITGTSGFREEQASETQKEKEWILELRFTVNLH